MAEWLRSGLQIREGRFDSGSGLHFFMCMGVYAERTAHRTRRFSSGGRAHHS